MKKRTIRGLLWLPGHAAVFFTMLAAGYGLTKYMGPVAGIFDRKGTLTAILSQLEGADISLHWLFPLVLTALHALIRGAIVLRGGRKRTSRLLWIPVWLLGFLFCFLLTQVNGIRTLDLLRVLIRLLQNGLTEVL